MQCLTKVFLIMNQIWNSINIMLCCEQDKEFTIIVILTRHDICYIFSHFICMMQNDEMFSDKTALLQKNYHNFLHEWCFLLPATVFLLWNNTESICILLFKYYNKLLSTCTTIYIYMYSISSFFLQMNWWR